MAIAVITHSDCLLHDTGPSHPERKERIMVINEAIQRYPFEHEISVHEAPLATKSQLRLAHDERYVEWIHSIAPKDDYIGIDQDTIISPGSLRAAQRAAGAVILAVDLVMRGKVTAAFCNIRPPGHHAEYEKAMGFCLFNNVAIGVGYALNHYHLKKVAIVDFDVHHGNGTQNIFQNNPQVLVCSSFQHPFYPGYDQESDNKHIVSVPLAAGAPGSTFRDAWETHLLPKIRAFKPELIFFSAGFDGHHQDPIGELQLGVEDYVWLTQKIAKIAAEHCGGKLISVLEGGYALEALAESVPAHIDALEPIEE